MVAVRASLQSCSTDEEFARARFAHEERIMRVFVVTPIALAMLLLPGNARADTLQEALAIAYQTNPS